jgi:hypothetical protein
MKRRPFLIGNRNALQSLLGRRELRKRLRWGQIVLRLDGLSPEENLSWQKKINRLYFNCGCSMGAAVMLLCMFLYGIYLIVGLAGYHQVDGVDFVVAIPILFSSALTGKIIGINRAKRGLRKAIRTLDNRLQLMATQ